MKSITVLYDPRCRFCVECARWMKRQRAHIRVECVPAGSRIALQRFGRYGERGEELTVVTDEGDVYLDASAWIMCLYALKRYRGWSLRLASPSVRPLARRAFGLLSRRRGMISRVLGDEPAQSHLIEWLKQTPEAECDAGTGSGSSGAPGSCAL